MGARKKASTKKASTKKPVRTAASRKATSRKTPSKAASSKRKTPTIETVARRIVRAARDFSSVDVADLYAPEAVSQEPGQPPAEGLAAISEKAEGFESLVDSATWNLRHQWIKGTTIALEWDAEIHFKNGRKASIQEIAVHEVRGGKIVSERYYYDPAPLVAAIAPEPEPPAPPLPVPEEPSGPSSPPPDAMDL